MSAHNVPARPPTCCGPRHERRRAAGSVVFRRCQGAITGDISMGRRKEKTSRQRRQRGHNDNVRGLPAPDKILPTYPLAQVARFVGCSPATLRSWIRGRTYSVRGQPRRSKPMLRNDSRPGEPLTFLDLVEAHILMVIRKGYRIPMKNYRAAIQYLREQGGDVHFLAHRDFVHDERHLYLKGDRYLISLSERGQHVDPAVIDEGLMQLMYGEDGYADRFYPRIAGKLQKTVMLTPAIGFGQPTIARLGVNTEAIAARFLAGEHLRDLATDYDADISEIEDAIRCTGELTRAG